MQDTDDPIITQLSDTGADEYDLDTQMLETKRFRGVTAERLKRTVIRPGLDRWDFDLVPDDSGAAEEMYRKGCEAEAALAAERKNTGRL